MDGAALNGRRVAVYARFSSDKQSDASIEDQVHRAREWVRSRGGEADQCMVFSDYAISGASMDRPGMRSLEDAVRRGAFDVLVTESVDRISRDVEDAARFRKLITHHEVELACLDGTRISAGGKSDALMFGMRALFAEQYRIDLADKTRRGLEGRARAGAATGAVAYGYRIVERGGSKVVEVDPERAPVIRRIFSMYARGDSLATVAEKLNADGVPPPRPHGRRSGSGWMHTAIRSMLLNERYRGVWSFGEREWVKAPGSNIRRPKERRGGALVTQARPDLAIVDAATWASVQERFARHPSLPKKYRSFMLSGILHCSACGGRMAHNGGSSRAYFACQAAMKRRTCEARKNIPVMVAQERFIQSIRRGLADHVDEVREIAAEELRAMRVLAPTRRAELERRLVTIEGQLMRLIDLVAESGSPTAAQKVRNLEADRSRVRAELAACVVEVAREPPTGDQLMERVLYIGRLADEPPDEARETVRRLLHDGKMYFTALQDGGWKMNWGLMPMALIAVRPPVGHSQGRPYDNDGCGGRIPRWSYGGFVLEQSFEVAA